MKDGSDRNAKSYITRVAVVAPPFYQWSKEGSLAVWADRLILPPDTLQIREALSVCRE
jgi:hypothetical protein